jgi:hypothetical protein
MKPECPAKHCAILVAHDRMVHAIASHPVAEVSFVPWWRSRLRFAFAFPGLVRSMATLLLTAAASMMTAGSSAFLQIAAAAAAGAVGARSGSSSTP